MKPPTSEPITAEKAPIHAESIRVKKSQFIVTTTEGGKLKDKLTRAAILRAGGLFAPGPLARPGTKRGLRGTSARTAASLGVAGSRGPP